MRNQDYFENALRHLLSEYFIDLTTGINLEDLTKELVNLLLKLEETNNNGKNT